MQGGEKERVRKAGGIGKEGKGRGKMREGKGSGGDRRGCIFEFSLEQPMQQILSAHLLLNFPTSLRFTY